MFAVRHRHVDSVAINHSTVTVTAPLSLYLVICLQMLVYSFCLYFCILLILVLYTSVIYSFTSTLICTSCFHCAAATTEFPRWGSIKAYLISSNISLFVSGWWWHWQSPSVCLLWSWLGSSQECPCSTAAKVSCVSFTLSQWAAH